MTSSAISTRPPSQALSGLAIAGFGLAVVALLLLVVAPLGWRAGWWSYGLSLLTLLPYAGYAAIAGGIVSALALVFGRGALSRGGLVMAVIGLLVGAGVAYVPWHWNNMRTVYPPINDITTDTTNPPTYTAVLAARAAENSNPVTYDPKTAAFQKKAYPDIAPVVLPVPPAVAFQKALAAAKAKGWTIDAADPAAGHIEASQSSFWFGFTDDVAIRVAADGSGSRIDIRSHARHGRGDFGVNANRIRGYIAGLKANG